MTSNSIVGETAGNLDSVNCPNATSCIAVGDATFYGGYVSQGIYTYGTLSGGIWTWTTEALITSDSTGEGYLSSVNCPNATSCMAIGEDDSGPGLYIQQEIYTYGTLSGGVWTWTTEAEITPDSSGRTIESNSVNCLTASSCISVGTDNLGQEIYAYGTLSGGVWTWTAETPITPNISSEQFLDSVSCPTTTSCMAVGWNSNFQGMYNYGTLSGGVWTWTPEAEITSDSSGMAELESVSCPTTTNCMAIGTDGGLIEDGIQLAVYTYGTLSGGVWTWTTEAPVTPNFTGVQDLNSISCLTTTSCIALGSGYEYLTFSTPPLNGSLVLQQGSTQTVNINPGAGYSTVNVLVDGISIGTPSSYTFDNITADHTIEADFAPTTNNITASVSGAGSINPSGTTAVNYGSDQLYNISPDGGYQISNVLVDGISVGTPSSYTFTNVTTGHTIEADFSPIPDTINASTVGSGSISLSGLTTLPTILVGSDITGEGALYGVSCPTTTICIAVGADFNGSHAHSVTSTGTLSGGVWSWTTETTVLPDAGDFANALTTVDCVSATMCVAAGTGLNGWITTTGTLSGGVWSWTQEVVVPPDFSGNVLSNPSAISCPNSTTCFLGGQDWDGNAITSIGTLSGGIWTWAAETTIAQSPSSLSNLYGMSCPSSTMCVASGYDNASGGVTSVGTLSGGIWTWAAETDVASDSSGWGNLVSISCPSTTLCVVTGIDGNQEGITSIGTFSGGNWSWTTESLLTTDSSGSGQPRAISCPTATSCIVVGQDGNYQEFTSVGTLSGGIWTWAPETVVTPDYTGSGELFGIGCLDSANCLAVGLDNTGPSNPPHQGIVVIGTLTSGPVPGGGLLLQPGSTQSFSVNPDPSNTITNVLIDGTSVGTPNYYTFSDVSSDHTIEADFAASSYNITSSVSGSGSISPNGTTAVAYGADQLFSISPNAGYQISNVLVDSVSVGTPSSYTFTDVTAGHSIEADFSLLTHILTASAGVGGSVSPSGAITVDDGSNQVIDVTPNTGYHISGYFSNSSYSCTPSGNDATCTVSDITSDQYLTADFALDTNTLTISGETGGSVAPTGPVAVNYGGSEVVDVTPNSGYHINGYSSNGDVSCVPSGSDSTCTISNVTSDRYFTADFASTPITPTSTFIITASADGPGKITPSGDITVTDNGSQVFTIAANDGSNIAKVLVDGVDQGPISSYSFTNVVAAHTIEAVFNTPVPVSTTTRPTHSTPLVVAASKPTANPITAITRFVSVQFNRVPTPIAIGFPWLLLILLLLMVLWATRLAYREARTVQARTELLHEEKRLSETKDTFLQLATHYLSTPLAKLTSGLELLVTTNPDLAILPKLQIQANDIHTASTSILESVNSESATQTSTSTSMVSDKVIGQAWRRLWIMVAVIGVLGFLIDDLAHSAKQIRTSTLAEATHAAIYVLLCFILYGVLRYYRIQHQNHEATDGLIFTQDNLSASRNRLIQTAYENLSVPVGSISLTAKELSPNTPAGRSILMAISDYRTILDKLKIVVELKNVPLASTQSINLVDVLEPVVVSFTPAIEAKHLSVNYANDIAEQKVLADPSILKKIVSPIIDNAIKFSADKGIITIGYEITHNNLSLTITDNGQGINPDYMTRLFQPFSRAEADALTFNHEGIGLSLYTSKLLAESLHGDISLSSVVGQGTKVSIKLPKPTKAAIARIARQQTTAQNVQPLKQQAIYG
jgi:signal transduction histidine kinase